MPKPYNVLDICDYIIKYCDINHYEISNLKLQKILYFIQVWFLVDLGEKCFNEKIEAWDFGPVVLKAYEKYKCYGAGDIPYINKTNCNLTDILRQRRIIEKKDKDVINSVLEMLKKYSAYDLMKIIHKQTPWIDAYNTKKHSEITSESILKFFKHE